MPRPAVMGQYGMVTSAHYLASMAGFSALRDGGNAVDAVVATAAALNVVEPYMSGLGGDGLMAITLPGAEAPIILDYSGGAPHEATLASMTLERMQSGASSLLVPGAPAGWLSAHERFGVLPRERVFRDAIALAEDGAPVSFRNTDFITLAADAIRDDPWAAGTFLPGGAPPQPGDLLHQSNLASTMRRLVEGGADEFYHGALGREIVAAVRAAGGVLHEDDLTSFAVEWQEPLSVMFREHQVFAPPPPSAGFQTLMTLKLLEGDDLGALGHNSADYLHLLIEAIKLAIADRIAYTMRSDIDWAALLESDYLRARRAEIDTTRAAAGPGERFDSPETLDLAAVRPGQPRLLRLNGEHTTHFAAADANGMAVNVTQSLGNPFGSGFMAGETGLMMNNFLNWIDLDPASPNALAGGKKMENCMSPTQVYRAGRFLMTLGTPGSWGIPQTQPQGLLNVLAFGMNVQDAIAAPRVRLMGGYRVHAERRIDAAVLADLSQRGHRIDPLPDYSWIVGGMHGIYRHPASGVLMGGADPRRDGYAVGW